MHARVLWAIIVGFLLGVGAQSLLALSWPWVAFVLLLGLSALALVRLDSRQQTALIFAAVFLASSAAGMLRTQVSARTADPVLVSRIDRKVVLEGEIITEPDVRENGVRLSVRARELLAGSSTIPVSAGVLVLAPSHTEARYGDLVRVSGTLRLPESFDAGEGRVFDYPHYLEKDGILFQLAFADVALLGTNQGNPTKSMAIALKQRYLRGLGEALQEPEAGLAGGITVGDKRSIGSDLSETFQRVSLIHMVVLSGYNITVVINAAASVLSWAGRTTQVSGSAIVVLAFILMSGGASTAVRAGAMALLAMYARVSGRQFIALRVLGVVCLLMVAWNPLILLYDPSFQLSALATLGLILFTPHFSALFSKIPERFGLREIAASTCGTQLAVLPLLLYQNGTLSLVALPANLLALLPMPLAMLASFVAAVAGMILGSYAAPFALPAHLILAYIIRVAEIFSLLPFAAVTIPAFGAWWLVFAYALLAALAVVLKKKARPEAALSEESR